MMEIYKEIDGVVEISELNGYSEYMLYTFGRDYEPKHTQLKAKLIIYEKPKAVITEDDFHRIWQKINGCTWKNQKEAELYRGLKKEFFKK